MKKQTFRITVRVEAEVEASGKPYLTEARVKSQIEKFLKNRGITEGLPCHGEATIRVTDCIETAG
jgi:hypothetical protein